MHWLKRDMRGVGIALAGLLFLLVLMVWAPVSAGAHEGALELPTPVTVTVQATPTVDATVTALNKEKLQHENDWWWSYGATILTSVLSTLVLVSGALIGFRQWRTNRNDTLTKESKDRQEAQDKELTDRADERQKEVAAQDKDLRAQAEERFKTAVTALGDKNEGTQVGGAILLRSFLNINDESIYGRYYTQIFDLAVAYLRLSKANRPSEDLDGSFPSPEDPNAPLPPTPLRQALIAVFKESFPVTRDWLEEQNPKTLFSPQSLDASDVKLEGAYLAGADLKQAWMPWASLREANLNDAILSGADLEMSDLKGARLNRANLTQAILSGADLRGAFLRRANLGWARLMSDHIGSKVIVTDLREADLREADLSGINLTGANLSKADLSEVRISEEIKSLQDTDLRGVKGLSKPQLAACKAKGAIIDEDSTTDSAQAAVSPAQVTTPPPSTDGSSNTPSQPSAQT